VSKLSNSFNKGKSMISNTAAATNVAAILLSSALLARDNIQIAGSSTVLPYASIVAEAFGENFDYPTPVVESGGSSAGPDGPLAEYGLVSDPELAITQEMLSNK
jgi:ABC-type phosphate transport system substrate-binding protein